MSEITRLIEAAAAGEPQAATELLPRVYDELRKLAAAKLASEKPGQTIQATALVHEVYLRLVHTDPNRLWNGRSHFFAVAAEAMRRILVDNARRKEREKWGGGRKRVDLNFSPADLSRPDENVIALSEAMDRLAAVSPSAAEIVKLRYFCGFTGKEAAELLGVSPRQADKLWAYARSWLLDYFLDESNEKKCAFDPEKTLEE